MARQGRVEELAGRGQDDRREDRRAARERLDPGRRQAEGAHPLGAGRGHAHPRPRAEARAAAVRRARRRVARRPARGRRARAGSRTCRASAPKAEENVLRGARRRRRRPAQGAHAAVEGARRGRGAGRRLCAITRRRIDVELAGSARRWADAVKDLDIVAASSDPAALVEAFCALPAIDEVQSSGRGRRARAHPLGPAGRPAHRARGGLRQPAPALHRARAGTTRRCAPPRSSAGCT